MRQLLLVVLCGSISCASSQSAPVETMPVIAGDMRALNGIRVIEVRAGTGAMVERGKCIYAHYSGWRTSGRKLESSLDGGGRPVGFIQGKGQVMRGWEIGFADMKVSGERRLFIPSELAYGDKGNPPRVPPGTPLIFDVKVVAVTDASSSGTCPALN